MARNYAAVFHEYLEEMDELSDAEFGRLVRALLRYSAYGELPEGMGNERFYIRRVMAQEDRCQESYDNLCQMRTEKARAAAYARWNKPAPSMPEHP